MGEKAGHKRAKTEAAGKSGKTEVPLPGGRRLDAATEKKAVEVERSGSPGSMRRAAGRLKSSGKPQRVLQVPQWDMDKAADAMQEAGVTGTVKNMGGTKSRRVTRPGKK